MLEQKDLEMIGEIVAKTVEPIKEKVELIEEKVELIEGKVESIEEEVESVKEEVKSVKKEVKEVQLTLEKEINRNITLVAEGHLDLSRKLDEALKIENEREMLSIRVNILESEVRRLKEKVEEIA